MSDHERYIDEYGLDTFMDATSLNQIKTFQDTDEQNHAVERIRMRDRAFMLEQLDSSDGPRLREIKDRMIPGSPDNLLHVVEYLGLAATLHASWDLSQRVMDVPGWEESLRRQLEHASALRDA